METQLNLGLEISPQAWAVLHLLNMRGEIMDFSHEHPCEAAFRW